MKFAVFSTAVDTKQHLKTALSRACSSVHLPLAFLPCWLWAAWPIQVLGVTALLRAYIPFNWSGSCLSFPHLKFWLVILILYDLFLLPFYVTCHCPCFN
jgi:hypothetical protein